MASLGWLARACIEDPGGEAWRMERSWISVNFAISADGKISPVAKRPSGWTSEADHRRLLELRAGADALLVGKGTLVADRMTMTVPGPEKQPLRCIVSRSGRLDPDLPVFQKPGGQIHLCVTGDAPVEIPGVMVHHQTLAGFLSTLAAELGVKRLHCEGGGELVRELMELDAIDEFHLTLAGHTIFGGLSAPTVTGIPGNFPAGSLDFELSGFEPVAGTGECFLSYRRLR
ncbi:MAG: RibD family protein [Verrucomicrobiaceae bacterium]|nr:MAG: RibD family protein [Verrucomicrobiaceae bacterium]